MAVKRIERKPIFLHLRGLLALVSISLLCACTSPGSVQPLETRRPSPTFFQPTQTEISSTQPPTVSFTPAPPTNTATPDFTPTITLTPTLISGPAPTLPPINVTLITNGDRDVPNVALTFDVGEKPGKPRGFDHEIEQVLIDMQAPATFFLGGYWMQRHPEIARRLALNPLFEIGSHSWSHPDFVGLTQDELSREILRTNDLYYQLTGESMSLFRLPAGQYDDLGLGMIAYHGMLNIYWDVVTADPVPDNDAEHINQIVQEGVQNGSIIVMHANGYGWHTAEALPEMISWLREQGYTLVTVSDLLGIAGGNR
ncbi:polysaccharide deacetylase family protein [Chloroflexota bacterium]